MPSPSSLVRFAAVLGALVLGCGADATRDPVVASPPLRTPPPPPPRVVPPYEPWAGAQVGNGCEVAARDPRALCPGASSCPVSRDEIALCGATLTGFELAASTVVFGFSNNPVARVTGFGYWPAGAPVHTVSAAGEDQVSAASRPGGPVHILRTEQASLVDYRIDGPALARRQWDYHLREGERLLDARWEADRLIARTRVTSSGTRDVIGLPDGTFEAGDTSYSGGFSTQLSPTRGPDGHTLSLTYGGASAVSVLVDHSLLQVSRDITRTMTSPSILLPLTAAGTPLFAFRSFDPNDHSGIHVLFPRAPLSGSAAVAVTDMHFAAGQLTRHSDCPQQLGRKPTLCTSSETDGAGPALTRTANGAVWLAFFVTERRHQALTSMVCPPPPVCAPGEPCRQAPCERVERNPSDTVRHQLLVIRLAPGGRGAELGLRAEIADDGGLGYLLPPRMTAEADLLQIAFKLGDRRIRRLQLDAAAITPVPLPPASFTLTETELQPFKG